MADTYSAGARAVLPPFSRVGPTGKCRFTPAGAYGIGALVGGLLAVDFGEASTPLRLLSAELVVPMNSNTTPGSGAAIMVFEEEPTGTFEDAVAPATSVWADNADIMRVSGLGFIWGPASGKLATYATQQAAVWPKDITTDADGMIYMAIVMNAVQWDAPGEACLTVPSLY